MNLIDKVVVKHFHENRIQKYGGGTTQALGWLDDQSQLLRFAMLADIGDMNNHSVLDIGCGHGDLRVSLGDKYPHLRYAGIDNNESFLAVADTRYAHLPDTTFFSGDFYAADLPVADYVLISGSLNYHSSDPGFIYKMITKLFNTCNIAVGFNLLSTINDPSGILVAYDAGDIMRHCKTLTSKIILHDKYCEEDFTVWMYR